VNLNLKLWRTFNEKKFTTLAFSRLQLTNHIENELIFKRSENLFHNIFGVKHES
jgi:hypothetical protein